MSRPNLDPPKNVHSYDSFMKKHLSNYGYYGNISEYAFEKIFETKKSWPRIFRAFLWREFWPTEFI